MVSRASFISRLLQSKFKLLQPDAYQQMHSKAAEWFKQQRYLMEAIYHAQQAEDQQLILSLLNSVCRELILEGRHYTFLELVKQIPILFWCKIPICFMTLFGP